MEKFKYIGKAYWSNCLFEALKAKLKNPRLVTIFFCPPRITENGNFQWCHFMWSDSFHSFDFSDDGETELPWYQTFWYKGRIRMFDPQFAYRYAAYRRNVRGRKPYKINFR